MITYSIIQKSKLEGAKRMDAEYYQPEYLDIENKLNNIKTQTIADISESVVNFGAYSLCNFIKWKENGVPYLNVQDIKDGYIDFDDTKFIDEKVNEILKKSKVREGQVILTMAGTIGNVAVAHKISPKVNSNQATAKITLKKDYSPYFLTAFLGSYYGKNQITREIVSSVQPNIFLFQIKNFKVPIVAVEKQKEIEKIYIHGLNELENSKLFYSQAEDLLLEEIGFKDFKNEENLFSVVNLSEAKNANRIDAEYFQTKYEKLISSLINCYPKKLSEVAKRKNGVVKINPKSEYKYIEISDVNAGNGEISFNVIQGNELPANAKMKIDGGELIISKVRPTRGAIAIIPDDWKNDFIASGAFSVFEVFSPMREYLQVVLRSIIGKLQLERPTTGTTYPTVTDEDVENILIPILPKPTQQKIAELVRQSHEARKKAKELLEEAKRKVEEIIEK
ncbi:MAG: restriction endonuclease subunit S [Patescibacteria group bacterium]